MNQLKGHFDQITHHLRFDGGSNPNPGLTAGAYWVSPIGSDEAITKGGIYLEKGTNNIGEYEGLLLGLERMIELGLKSVLIEGDSLLVISQISKKWKANHPEMETRRNRVWKLLEAFEHVACRHIPRKENHVADQLSDKTLEEKKSWAE